MRTFIGVIDIIRKEGRSPFYNFKPLREIVDGVLIKVDYNELLPESQAENINLRYTFQSDEEYNYMSDNFANRELYVIDFEKNELEDNYNNDNERLNTGYLLKIDMLRKNNRIRPLYQTKNIIQVYSSKKVNKDSLSSNNIYIIDEYTGIREGQKIYIQLKEENNDFFAGPYTVQKQKNKSAIAPSSFYINTNIEKPIFIQIAEQLEDSIFTGIYPEETKIPSTNEFSTLLNINPHTVLKGMNLLVDDEIIYKKRGLGMFVKEGAVEKIRQKRQGQFYDQFIATLIEEANKLNMSKDEIIKLIERGYDNECNSN